MALLSGQRVAACRPVVVMPPLVAPGPAKGWCRSVPLVPLPARHMQKTPRVREVCATSGGSSR